MNNISIKGFDDSFLTEQEVLVLMRAKGITIVDYNPEIDHIINMSGDEASKISLGTVSNQIIMLGQGLIYLDNQRSVAQYIYTKLKTQFDELMADAEKDMQGRTVGERRANAYRECPDLKKISNMVNDAKLEMDLLDGKTDMVREFLQTLKRKQDVLLVEYTNRYRSLD